MSNSPSSLYTILSTLHRSSVHIVYLVKSRQTKELLVIKTIDQIQVIPIKDRLIQINRIGIILTPIIPTKTRIPILIKEIRIIENQIKNLIETKDNGLQIPINRTGIKILINLI